MQPDEGMLPPPLGGGEASVNPDGNRVEAPSEVSGPRLRGRGGLRHSRSRGRWNRTVEWQACRPIRPPICPPPRPYRSPEESSARGPRQSAARAIALPRSAARCNGRLHRPPARKRAQEPSLVFSWMRYSLVAGYRREITAAIPKSESTSDFLNPFYRRRRGITPVIHSRLLPVVASAE